MIVTAKLLVLYEVWRSIGVKIQVLVLDCQSQLSPLSSYTTLGKFLILLVFFISLDFFTFHKMSGRGINQEFGTNIYILPYIKQVNNKDLLYSTKKLSSISCNNLKMENNLKEGIYIFINVKNKTKYKNIKFFKNIYQNYSSSFRLLKILCI